MDNKLETKNDLESSKKEKSNERALEALLSMVEHGQKKAASKDQLQEGMQKALETLQGKLGISGPVPTMSVKDLCAFIMNPSHFSHKERELIRLLWRQMARLQQKKTFGPSQRPKGSRKIKYKNQFV